MPLISIVKKSDVLKARRFDAEYFKPEYLEIEEKLYKIGFLTIKNISNDSIEYGTTPEGGVFENEGIPYIKSEFLKDKIIFDKDSLLFCKKDFHKRNMKSEVLPNDILFSAVGSTIGEVAILSNKIERANTNQNIAKLRVKNSDFLPNFVFIYFLSKYGNKQLERYKTGNAQPYLNSLQIKSFKIPILPQSFQLEIEKTVKEAHHKQAQSKALYREAEQILLEELGLVNYIPKNILTFATTKKAVDQAKRFDAEYFQPKYAEIIKRIEKYPGGWDIVGNVVRFNDKNFFPKENEHYYYIPLSKVSNNGKIEIPQKEIGKDLPKRARRLVKKGEVILSSISGSLETSAIIEEEHNHFIVSNGFYVFNSDKINSETLLTLFKSQAMLQLLKQISKGAILGGYDLTAFKNLKIPLIAPPIQARIAEKIQASHELRRESKELLERAKRKVEEEIEKA